MSSRTQPQSQPQAKPTATSSETAEQKGNYDKLLIKLTGRGISLVEFAHVDERRRKRMLQDEYQELKDDGKWQYDEPIELPAEVYEKEKQMKEAAAKEVKK
jgi:hypothetical protein